MTGQDSDYGEFLKLVRGRRTIRAIKPHPVPAGTVQQLLEAARWAPTGFNLQPVELLVVEDLELREAVRKIIQDWIDSDFYVLEATREDWQGAPWKPETHGMLDCPMAPLFIFILGDTRRLVGLPMNARYSRQKADSIFETSLANAFMYLWLAAHSLGLAAQPVSAVKNERVQGLVKHLLNLPDFIYVYELLVTGYSAMEGGPSAKLLRHLDEMVHYGRAADDEFLTETELRKQIRKLRSGNVARHTEADRINPKRSD
ncbi:MAG: nitroreductase family protein [Actinobacteria bacterium]|nr:nitroreductase family protein [Actinomycetota bacterium]